MIAVNNAVSKKIIPKFSYFEDMQAVYHPQRHVLLDRRLNIYANQD